MLPVERTEYSRFREYTHNLPFLFGIFNCNIYAGVVSSARETTWNRANSHRVPFHWRQISGGECSPFLRRRCQLIGWNLKNLFQKSATAHAYNATFSQGYHSECAEISTHRGAVGVSIRFAWDLCPMDAGNGAAATPGVGAACEPELGKKRTCSCVCAPRRMQFTICVCIACTYTLFVFKER